MCVDLRWVPVMHTCCRCNCTQFPRVSKNPRGVKRINGYIHKTFAYGSPELVEKIFTGKLTPTYFNDICYGRRPTPQEYRYNTPIVRTTALWEPKHVSREKTRHVIRDIQDARFRKHDMLEKATVKKEKEHTRKIEAALTREAELVTRGIAAYQTKIEREKQKYDAKIAARKQKRKPKTNSC
ncbi:uncharacterized protein LOC123532732 isoform X2 [Mercenaria mercenaria]|uniref:uncharacterized protein LOC123532732 isoform X2 n=1 Tax=Mercenaria mercenaria TaxID=6596 RepID=UPI00234E9061|nr:uncharacterized protein LOC123532732 isoform X2 [Mercenaria mercenaria]